MLKPAQIREMRRTLTDFERTCANEPGYEEFHAEVTKTLEALNAITDATGQLTDNADTPVVAARAQKATTPPTASAGGNAMEKAKQELIARLHSTKAAA